MDKINLLQGNKSEYAVVSILGITFLFVTILISCGYKDKDYELKSTKTGPTTNKTPEARRENSAAQDPNLLCNRVSEVKVLPFKGEQVDDPAYNALINAGETVLPCLIEQVTNTTRMRDPRQAPKYEDTTVGDVAYFIIIHITKLDFTELLPTQVQNDYKEEGVYAYFKFVEKKENRRKLKIALDKWYHEKYKQNISS